MTSFDSFAARHALAYRRGFVDAEGGLSAVGLALLAQSAELAPAREAEGILCGTGGLCTALESEKLLWSAYTDALENGALDATVRAMALLFQRHHASHITALERTLQRYGRSMLGNSALQTAIDQDPVEPLDFSADTPTIAAQLARRERALCQSYLKAAPLAEVAHAPLLMRLAAQCAVHYGALTQGTGEPLEA